MRLSHSMIHKRWLVGICLISFAAIVSCGLISYKSADEKDRVVDVKTQCERSSTTVIDRKEPLPIRRKMLTVPIVVSRPASPIGCEEKMNLRMLAEEVGTGTSLAELASEKNQVMDALLDRPQVPSDYADVMIGLYRDKSQDVLTRAFAVQHIGLYARDLSRRGEYSPDSADARENEGAELIDTVELIQ